MKIITKNISTIILGIIVCLIPLLIIPTQNYNDLRIILLWICGIGLLITTILRIKSIKLNKADIFLLVFGVIATISTFLSLNVKQSIIGSVNRYEGILTIYIYILIYFNAKNFFKKYKHFENIIVIIYMAICLFAIVQYYMPKTIVFMPLFGKGAHGTIGHPNFMGSFISIILPAFLLLYIVRNKNKYLVCSIISFSVGVLCATRSCWAAFVYYLFIIVIYLLLKRDKNYLKRFAILIFTLLLTLGIILLIPKEKSYIKNKVNAIKKDVQIIQEDGVSNDKLGSARMHIWKMTLKLILKTPVLGCGVDDLKDGLIKFSTEEYISYLEKYKEIPDKAHNEYLQIAATMGIPALSIYLGFISLIIIPNIKRALKDEKVLILILVSTSYLVQAFFNISVISVAPIFWFILGRLSKYNNEEIVRE